MLTRVGVAHSDTVSFVQNVLVEEHMRYYLVKRRQTDVLGVWAMQHDGAQYVDVHLFVHVDSRPQGSIVEGVEVLGGIENVEQAYCFSMMLKVHHGEHLSSRQYSVLPSLEEFRHCCLK